MRRYLRLLGVQMRASALLAMQYRLDFVIYSLMSLVWTATAIVPLVVLFRTRHTVAGWTWPEALLVIAWFTLLKGVLDGAIQPSLTNVVEHIRKGTLDFVLLKPADAQFMVSTTRFELRKATDLLAALGMLVYGLHRVGHVPSVAAIGSTVLLLVGAVTILYGLWIVVISLAFVFVRIDNLSFLLASIYDAARWPASIFRGVLAFIFTFVIPLAVMTTYPALAILDRLRATVALEAFAASAAFAWVARRVWLRAIGHYTSAGG